MIEEWRQITEAPDCEVSNYGNVRVRARTITTVTGAARYYNPRIISQNRKKSGYIEVALPVGKGKRIYRKRNIRNYRLKRYGGKQRGIGFNRT